MHGCLPPTTTPLNARDTTTACSKKHGAVTRRRACQQPCQRPQTGGFACATRDALRTFQSRREYKKHGSNAPRAAAQTARPRRGAAGGRVARFNTGHDSKAQSKTKPTNTHPGNPTCPPLTAKHLVKHDSVGFSRAAAQNTRPAQLARCAPCCWEVAEFANSSNLSTTTLLNTLLSFFSVQAVCTL